MLGNMWMGYNNIVIPDCMNKDLLLGNKIIYQKMHKKQRKRHLSKLQEIKSRPNSFQVEPPFFRQTSLPSDSEKIIEIERNNIVLFNRIASIIKERPKISFPKSRYFVKSLDNALFTQEKKQNELKIKHELYSKRISEQQPTIKNQLIFKERMKHQRYLKFIGKYPYNPRLRTQSDFQLTHQNNEQPQEIFHQKTLDFQINISKDSNSGEYIFNIVNLIDQRQFRLAIPAETFRQEFAQCGLSYQKMVGKLRMDRNGSMRYQTQPRDSPSTLK